MKNLLLRFWKNLFAVPAVTLAEGFVFRTLFAAVLYWYFYPSMVQFVQQPEPVGLAHWFDLTWMRDPAAFAALRAVFLGLLIVYVAGLALPVTLPLLTLVHVLPLTLHNSQGFTFHGNQILSLTLMGQAGTAIWLAATGRAKVRDPYPARQVGLALGFIVVAAVLAGYVLERYQGFNLASLYFMACLKLGVAASPEWIGPGNMVLCALALAVIFGVPAFLLRPWQARGVSNSNPDGWMLLMAQFMIAGAYLISVFSKIIRSDGEWLVNSYYVALDFVKTMRQNYYSSLDPQFAVPPPDYIVMMLNHPVLTAIFFDIGVALEAFMILAIGNRKWTFLFGASLIFMHCTISRVMNLFFPTHVAMLAIFWVAPLLLRPLVGKRLPDGAMQPA